ncbi:MAG: type II secretion system secretin GspD [Rhodospirillales bacterium]|nr:type II secretion system secretin GspD [Rhodospirillales bacterium]
MAVVAFACVVLAGCQSPESGRRTAQFLGIGGKEAAAPRVPVPLTEEGAPTQLKPEKPPSARVTGALGEGELYYGTGPVTAQPAVPTKPVEVEPETGAVSLNFVNADIREVIDTVLGNTLKVSYIIDPRVQGTVTLRTTRPLPAGSVIGILEDVLAMNGAALTKTGDIYKIIPLEQAVTSPAIIGQGMTPVVLDRGFGLHVIPLRYVSATALVEVVRPFVPPGRVIQADPQRNVLIFVGTGSESVEIADLIGTFDVDWMAGMSFGLFPVQNAKPQSIVDELTKVFAPDGTQPPPGMVEFVPIDRLEAVLVISRQPAYLDQARQWIARLDRGVPADVRQLYVYFVQNGRAVDLAEVLGQVFGISTATTGEAAPQLAPGLTPTEISRPGTTSYGTTGLETTRTQTAQTETTAGEEPAREPRQLVPAEAVTPSPAPPAAAGGETGPRIVADDRNNALLIYATVDEYRPIESALAKLDIVPLQVMIEATIIEVTLNDTLKYGIEWFFSHGEGGFTLSAPSTDSLLNPTSLVSGATGFTYLLNTKDVQVVITALTSVTDVKVISSPQLLVLDNQTARLQVGDEVPILARSTGGILTGEDTTNVISEVEYRDTGVILDIIPRVNASGLVTLDIIQEVSDVAPTLTTGATTVQEATPTIQQRKISSTVAVHSGDIVALGGLIRDTTNNSVSGIPVLSEIPILGNLFKTTTDSVRRTELLVLLKPRVIRDRADARAMTEELRKRLKGLQPLETKIE